MAKYALLDSNNKVTNTIEIEPEIVKDWFPNAVMFTDEMPVCVNGFYDTKTKTFSLPIDSENNGVVLGEITEPKKVLE